MLYLKKHEYQGRFVVAVCDEDLIGKHFQSEGLSLHISEHFYKGELIAEGDLAKHIGKAYLLNLAGQKALLACKALDLVDDARVLTVDGVPHAQILLLTQ